MWASRYLLAGFIVSLLSASLIIPLLVMMVDAWLLAEKGGWPQLFLWVNPGNPLLAEGLL